MDAILESTKDLTSDDRLLVHCHQGVSRSTAAGIGIMMQHGMGAEAAYRYVKSIRDILLPNGLIIRMLDDRFNLGGEIVDLVMNERRAKIKMQTRMYRSIDANDHGNLVAMKSILEKLRDI